ncbi:MAG: hypothetical protein WB615_05830, partial [Candidatus Tumulicola sp.]
ARPQSQPGGDRTGEAAHVGLRVTDHDDRRTAFAHEPDDVAAQPVADRYAVAQIVVDDNGRTV